MTVGPTKPAPRIRFDLVISLWGVRLLLLWGLLYPVYELFASSPSLQMTNADVRLFTSGSEQLVSLVSAQVRPLSSLAPAMTLLAVGAAGCALLASTASWVTVARSYSLCDARLWLDCLALLPRFAGVCAAWLVIVFGLATVWWELLPAIGSLLLPVLGERRTDFCHLLAVALLSAMMSGSFLLADLTRALSIARPTLDVVECVRGGLAVFRSQPAALLAQASWRFLTAILLQVANVWLIGRLGWLASPHPNWLLACLTTEAAALCAIWLRLSWMAWLGNLLSGGARSATRKDRNPQASIPPCCPAISASRRARRTAVVASPKRGTPPSRRNRP